MRIYERVVKEKNLHLALQFILGEILTVFDCIFNRRSTRSFNDNKVDDRLIGIMLYSAIHAPSAGNTQDWHFIVVRDEKIKERLYNAALKQAFIKESPVIIVVCVDKEKIGLKYGKRGEALYGIQDTAAATMNMLLAAEGLGLRTCWVGAFDEEKVGHVLELPSQLRPVSIVPVGYSDEIKKKPRRIDFERVTHINTYGQKYSIADAVKTAGGKDLKVKPIGNYIEDTINDILGKRKK